LFTGLLCVRAIFRINHVAKTISLLASRMPVRLEVFLQFSFSNIMFLLHYTCSVLRKRNSRKAFKFLSKRLILLLNGNQYRNLILYVLYTKQRICGRWGVPGVGNCLSPRAWGWGIDHQLRKKLQIPGGMSGASHRRQTSISLIVDQLFNRLLKPLRHVVMTAKFLL